VLRSQEALKTPDSSFEEVGSSITNYEILWHSEPRLIPYSHPLALYKVIFLKKNLGACATTYLGEIAQTSPFSPTYSCILLVAQFLAKWFLKRKMNISFFSLCI